MQPTTRVVEGYSCHRRPRDGIALAATMSKGLSSDRHGHPGVHRLRQSPTAPALPPYAFTEQGVAMLSSVLRSSRAVQVNIAI